MNCGTHACYANGCRCSDCRDAHRRYTNSRRIPLSIDAGPFTEVLGALYRAGEGIPEMARVTGLHEQTIRRVTFGEATRVQQRTAAKLRRVLHLFPGAPPHPSSLIAEAVERKRECARTNDIGREQKRLSRERQKT